MTWHTSAGDRYLTGAESSLFRAALKETLESFDRGELECTDTVLEIQAKQAKLHLFALVGKYLLEPTSDFAPLNAWTEGAVGVVFCYLANRLDEELESDPEKDQQNRLWRDRILAAAVERAWKGGGENVNKTVWLDSSDWYEMLEFLEEQILWGIEWAADPFGSQAGDFNRDQQSYFQWCHRSPLDTHAVIKLLGELCGYRRSQLEGNEKP